MSFTPFDIDDAFQDYLRRVELTELPEYSTQYKESKRAFVAGLCALMVHMRDEVTKISDDEGVAELGSIEAQAAEFWQREAKDYKDGM